MDLTGFGRGSRHARKGPGTRTTDSPAATVAEIQLELDEAEQLAEAMALSAKEEVARLTGTRTTDSPAATVAEIQRELDEAARARKNRKRKKRQRLKKAEGKSRARNASTGLQSASAAVAAGAPRQVNVAEEEWEVKKEKLLIDARALKQRKEKEKVEKRQAQVAQQRERDLLVAAAAALAAARTLSEKREIKERRKERQRLKKAGKGSTPPHAPTRLPPASAAVATATAEGFKSDPKATPPPEAPVVALDALEESEKLETREELPKAEVEEQATRLAEEKAVPLEAKAVGEAPPSEFSEYDVQKKNKLEDKGKQDQQLKNRLAPDHCSYNHLRPKRPWGKRGPKKKRAKILRLRRQIRESKRREKREQQQQQRAQARRAQQKQMLTSGPVQAPVHDAAPTPSREIKGGDATAVAGGKAGAPPLLWTPVPSPRPVHGWGVSFGGDGGTVQRVFGGAGSQNPPLEATYGSNKELARKMRGNVPPSLHKFEMKVQWYKAANNVEAHPTELLNPNDLFRVSGIGRCFQPYVAAHMVSTSPARQGQGTSTPARQGQGTFTPARQGQGTSTSATSRPQQRGGLGGGPALFATAPWGPQFSTPTSATLLSVPPAALATPAAMPPQILKGRGKVLPTTRAHCCTTALVSAGSERPGHVVTIPSNATPLVKRRLISS